MNALDLAYIPIAAATAPWWAFKKRRGWKERFGVLPKLAPPAGKPRLMIHAVSVGEVNALRHLIPILRDEFDLVVSASTDTGLARANELYSQVCSVIRYPLDFSWAVARLLDAAMPDAVALVELEVWPNFVRECSRRHIPVCVINGRLSERSYRGYRKVARFFGGILRQLAFVAVQDPEYAERFERLGVPPGVLHITGSMKWDAAQIADFVPGADELAAELGIDRTRPLIVAGSTGPGEEALLLNACPPDVQLLCAPRKPERFNEAASVLNGCRRRSLPVGTSSPSRLFLLDTIGELRKAYSLADVIVVGRSFGDMYGSDPIEPAALGKPILIGPSVSDFAQIVRALDEAGGLVRTSRETLAADLARLLAHPTEAQRIAENARLCIRSHQGASERHAHLLRRLIASKSD
ncbi:MAG: hypothetical protein JNK25_13185 [Phycisphaerae bacterium]|nr:hypothetical protein [Phycisphaerae bacterium]